METIINSTLGVCVLMAFGGIALLGGLIWVMWSVRNGLPPESDEEWRARNTW